MRNRRFNIDRSKPIYSQVENIFFNINRISSITVNDDFFNIIQKNDSLRQYLKPVDNDVSDSGYKFMNCILSINSSQEEDITIEKTINKKQ